ncbi:MAG: PepSY domain-containing protein [Methylomonas sp.]|nr:PepSY domain-containing protein [Methylomonas sp.]PPD20803.1 MAG: peptidase [Methylomonas sp.]PPD27274.1 MAG: peptidase [Methylomonas sp.]PPD38258.1 MAG: peptidase [Methylomonas sp.]PPD39245.1 MAG: peptidase [Methylomonas sp.]
MQQPDGHSGKALVRYRRRWLSRNLWRNGHRLLALLTGLPLVVIGLSGGLSVYRDSIDLWLNPALYIEASDQPLQSLDSIMSEIRKTHPNRHGSWTLEMPRSPHGTITAWFEKPKESVGQFYAPLMVSVDPYTGKVVASRFWGDTFATWLLDLHSRLLLDDAGGKVMAGLALALAVLTLSGLSLWWPTDKPLKSAFALRVNSGLMRLLMDSHRLLGLVSAGFLLLLAFTGFHLSYPEVLESLTAAEGMAHGDAGPNVRSTAIPNDRPVSLAEAVVVARGLFPRSEVRRISTPQGDLGTYRINLRQAGELNQQHPFTTVWIDRWSGQIRAVNNPGRFTPGQTFTTWQWPLHTGEALGNGAKALWLLTGFAPLLLLVSGVCHWLHRKGWLQDRAIDWRRTGKRLAHWLESVMLRLMLFVRYRVYPIVRRRMAGLLAAIGQRLR